MIRHNAAIALAAAVLAATGPTPAAAQDDPAPRRVLVALAHPDDELFMAPAIAALVREGSEVTLAYATQGDVGPGVSGMEVGAKLAAVRLGEAQCSQQALGVQHLVSFNRGDGKMGIDVQKPGSAANLALGDFAGTIPGFDLVLTWGPDGGYGHADHRMVSAFVTQVVQAVAGEARPRLMYVGIPAGSLPPVPEMATWAVTDPALLTATVAYSPADLAAASAAALCHATQFDEASRRGMMGLFDATMWRGTVHFRPAF